VSVAVLLFSGFYLPGYKGGGPIRTIANMLQALGQEIDFSLVTSDRDLGDGSAYPSISPNIWIRTDSTTAIYLSSNGFLRKLNQLISGYTGDAIHLNSFFSFRFSILPLLLWRIHKPGRPVILGPRGEFSQGALALKSAKKRAYLALVKHLGLYKNVIWHASTEHEAADIRRVMGASATVRIAIDIAQPGAAPNGIKLSIIDKPAWAAAPRQPDAFAQSSCLV